VMGPAGCKSGTIMVPLLLVCGLMPTFRNRNRSLRTTGSGKAIRSYMNLVFYNGFNPIDADHEFCDDHTQPPPFEDPTWWNKSRSLSVGGALNGTVPYSYAGGGTVTFSDVRTQNRTGYQYAPATTEVDWTYWRTLALANLDPYRPVVDTPLFLFELREFPRMLRDLGRVLQGRIRPSDVPGGYVAYQFGWRPLVSDLLSMLTLQRQINDRIRYFRNLAKGTRVRRRLATRRLIKDTTTANAYQQFNVGPAGDPYCIKADVQVREYISVWFTANASLLMDLPKDADLRGLSTRAVWGLTARPSTLWNAIPWSWFTDYMLNVGDYMEAANGMTRYRCTNMCLMALSLAESRLTNVRLKTGLSFSPSTLYTERKQRSVSANPQPGITAEPFLTNRQQLILGSLATASALRGARR
jgi:hypothetical protein